MSSSQLILAPLWRHFFSGWPVAAVLGLALALCPPLARAAGSDVQVTVVGGASVVQAREAVVEAIEAVGLPVTAVLPFQQMLARTAPDLGQKASPYAGAEIVQFCSARLAWRLVEEAASHLALCPLSIAVYEVAGEAGTVRIAYRSPGRETPGRAQADDLLRDLVARAALLARQRW